MKKIVFYSLVLFGCAGCQLPIFAENIAYLVPGSIFDGFEDPINIPEDKEYVLETMILNEAYGLNWFVLHVEELGHVVNIYNSDEDDPADVEANNDLIVISEALGSGSIAADYLNTSKPLLSFEIYLLDDMGFVSENLDFTGRAHADEIHILDANHPITRGLPETFTATINDPNTNEPAVAVFGTWRKNALNAGVSLAELPETQVHEDDVVTTRTSAPILTAVEAGSELNNQSRWVFLGYSDEAPVEEIGGNLELRTLMMLSEDGIKLLDQTIEWLLGNEPTYLIDWPIQ